MDIAEFSLGLIGRALERRQIGDVDLDRVGANIEGGQFLSRDLKPCLLDVREHDVDAVARQGTANAQADPVGGAGDKRGLAGKLHHRRMAPVC